MARMFTVTFLMLRPWQTRKYCCRHKCFPVCPGNICCGNDTNFVSGTQKMFLCPQQMFPSLRSPGNIMSNNVSATMCPRLLVSLGSLSKPRRRRQQERHQTKGLMSRTVAVHVRYKSLYISLPANFSYYSTNCNTIQIWS